MQSGSRNPGNHTNYMVTGHPNNGLQDLGCTLFWSCFGRSRTISDLRGLFYK
ncbi:hypothetical protein [Bathymodiolus heckerae thiotrophic gill symbiont]|uniref:hypothetical protein n=1 Tax=Bathymodiolus heckerae thiotrophic gill symbiont TaxID=1052212 RepID=UPI001BB1706B|nr:hypothetical protein [Bathymodiolus heckerae thiotrophic gill symbiont]